jgi:nitroreductase
MAKLKRSAKDLINNSLPSQVLVPLRNTYDFFSTASDGLVDIWLYLRFMSSTDKGRFRSRRRLDVETQIIKDYHRIEKGLALKETKRNFGLELRNRLNAYLKNADMDSPISSHSLETLRALDNWNQNGEKSDKVSPVESSALNKLNNAEDFFGSRRSVRDFSDEAPSLTDVLRAAQMSLHTPSVCNRQPWKLRIMVEPTRIQKALSLQNGNSGFTDQIKTLALVTVDIRLFSGSGERHQAWIEGGLFAMTFVWAIHSQGLNSCMLNLSQTISQSSKFRKSLQIPMHEVPIAMIAIGKARAGHRVAKSPRRPKGEVIIGSTTLEL